MSGAIWNRFWSRTIRSALLPTSIEPVVFSRKSALEERPAGEQKRLIATRRATQLYSGNIEFDLWHMAYNVKAEVADATIKAKC